MTEPKETEPFHVSSLVTLDKEFESEKGSVTTPHRFLADPDSEWRPGDLPDEPTWANPPRTVAEAHARAYALERFWVAIARAPYATRRQGRKRRPLTERDFIRPTDPPLVCERCGKAWARARRGRGPIPRLCPDCRQASRNAN
jgi:hypothetical protein